MTTLLVLVILGLIWAAVLVPPYLQNRREHRPGDSIASFRHQLSVLERATPEGRARSTYRREVAHDWDTPRAAYAPARRPVATRAAMARPAPVGMRPSASVRKRRRDIFLTLLAAVPVTFLLAFAMGGAVWGLHLLVDVAFVGYVALLIKIQQETAEKELKVRFLQPTSLRAVDQQPLLRRVGS